MTVVFFKVLHINNFTSFILQKAMNNREAQFQQCCDEKDRRIEQLEEMVSQLSEKREMTHEVSLLFYSIGSDP